MLTTVTTSFENGAGTSNNKSNKSVREQSDKQKLKLEEEKKEEEEEVIAIPLWQDNNQIIIKPPMESIPEVEEIESIIIGYNNNNIVSPNSTNYLINNNNNNNLSKSPSNILIKKRKEVYRTEEIDTLVSTLPKEVIPPEWDKLATEEIVNDPKMAHTYITEINDGIPPTARGNKYSYIYESKLEEDNEEKEKEEKQLKEEISENEKICKSTQKITKITKITTTRSVKQFPIEPSNLFFDIDGNPIINGFDEVISSSSSPSPAIVGKVLSNFECSEDELLPSSSGETIIAEEDNSVGINLINNNKSSSSNCNQQKYKKETPSKPGIPQINECFEEIIDGEGEIVPLTISLFWSSPKFNGTEGPLIGYRVEFRRSELEEWEPAHDDLLGENECKITNLDPEDNYQFRVIGANIAGFGLPSEACPPIRLRPESTQFSIKAECPPLFDRPQIINIESDCITIKWKPPSLFNLKEEINKINYLVQYKEINLLNWINAIELPIKECQLEILNLRPNGEYEFRIICKNEENGKELISPSSGFIRIRPSPSIKNEGIFNNKELLPPGKPKLIEFGQNWIKLNWECPIESSNLAYLVEIREFGNNNNNWKQLFDNLNNNNYTTINNNFIVNNLSPNYQYEFRIWSISLINYLLRSSIPSPISEPINLLQLLPQLNNNNKKVPERPSAPEYIESFPTSLTLCWQPAKSSLPVQGYEIEFRDLMQDATNWYRLTTSNQLIKTCKTSIGSLLCGHQYQFRILAKNYIGLSNPSDPSPLITIRGEEEGIIKTTIIPLMEEIFVRESPPLPDRDDSPPPIYKQIESSLQWRDPTLKEVIDYLKSPDLNLVLNSSGYLQHLTFNNDLIKEETKNYGGIECLINILNSSNNPEILRNVCGSLKNLAFGKTNDTNKKLIYQKNGLKALSQLLKTCKNSFVHEEATGALWNISSSDELKEPILNQTAEIVIRNAVIPSFEILFGQQSNNNIQNNNNRNPIAIVFRNGTGILRNISAVNDQSRRFLRSSPGLIETLLNFLHFAVQKNQLDTRSAENVICLLRNLSYRIQEVIDNKYNPNKSKYQIKRDELLLHNQLLPSSRSERSKSAPSGSPKMSTNSKKGKQLFRRRKKSENELSLETKEINLKNVGGPQLLWNSSTIKLYLKILEESANCEILEASASAIQNLAGCPFYGSLLVRETVRIEKGLPILVELLRLREDKVVCAVCCALRNLALDQRNLELIGRFALADILIKIPNNQQFELIKEEQQLKQKINLLSSDLTLNAILGILWEIVKYNYEMAKLVHQTIEGTERLRALAKSYPIYGRRTCKYATQVLYIMWQYKELHELFKESGLEESDFYSSGILLNKGKSQSKEIIIQKQLLEEEEEENKHSPSSIITTNTLARPFSSQGMERPSAITKQLKYNNNNYEIFNCTTTTTTTTTPPFNKSVSSSINNNNYKSFSNQKQPLLINNNKQIPNNQLLYSSIQKGNGHHENQQKEQQRRQSIDSWV